MGVDLLDVFHPKDGFREYSRSTPIIVSPDVIAGVEESCMNRVIEEVILLYNGIEGIFQKNAKGKIANDIAENMRIVSIHDPYTTVTWCICIRVFYSIVCYRMG